MIILDTHIWIWWVSNSSRLNQKHKQYIDRYSSQGLGVSIISGWEVAKLVEKNRLDLSISVDLWLEKASNYPNVQLLNLTVPIIVQSTQLLGFHNDPADHRHRRFAISEGNVGLLQQSLWQLQKFMIARC